MSLFDQLDQLEKENGGGGGYVGKINFQIGYKVFISGMSNEDSFFPFNPADDANKADALAKANSVVSAAGSDKKPNNSVQFRLYKDTILGRDVTWEQDQFYVYPTWTDGWKDVVRPALKEAGVSKIGEFWGRITFTEDPSGRTRLDNVTGEEKPALIGYLIEVYPDEATASAAAGGGASAPTSKYTVPADWTADSWAETAPDVLDELGKDPDIAKKKEVAETWGLSIKDINTLLSEV